MGFKTGAAAGMLASCGAGIPVTAGMAAGAATAATAGTGDGIPARTAGSGAGIPARTVGSSTAWAGTGGRGRVVGDKVFRGSGEVGIISVGVSDRLGEATAPTSTYCVGSPAPAVPNIGTSGCSGWFVVLAVLTTVGAALIIGVAAAAAGVSTEVGAGAVGATEGLVGGT